MRMAKIKVRKWNLERPIQKFILVKEAQQVSDLTMRDYIRFLQDFLKSSHNSIEYDLLEMDVLAYFSKIPDSSPARYNRPFQYINAFLNWMVDENYIPRSPIKAHQSP